MPQERKLAAIMFTDIVGYTSLMEVDEKRALKVLEKNRKIHKPIIKKFKGKWLKEMGDGVLASFQTISDAVYCAIEIQQACKSEPDLKLRIGIHQGEVTFQGEDVFGSGVNIASRLEEIAPIGGIYVSESVYRNIQNKSGITAEYIGEETLKNVKHPVRVYEVSVEENKIQFSQPEIRKVKKRNPYLVASGIIILLLVAILIWLKLPINSSPKIDPNVEKSIAILPFKNLSDDQSNQYFCDGVMEGILNNLSQIKDLRVLSRSSTDKYRETTPPSPQIAEELKVNYLVEGSVFKSGDRIRLTAQLIDARNDEHIWSKQYDKEIQDIFNVMSDVSKEVASEIEVVITPEVKERIESIPTKNQEAYDLFLRGKKLIEEENGNETTINTAIYFFKQAIELDSQFALTYIHLGVAYESLSFKEFSFASLYLKESFLDTFKIYIEKALTIDPDLPEGYEALSSYYILNGEFDKAIEYSKKAIELRPNNSAAIWLLANNYKSINDYVKAILNYNEVKKLMVGTEDYPYIIIDLGNVYHDISYYDKAEYYYEEYVKYNPLSGYRSLSVLAENNGQWDKMKQLIDKICTIDSGRICKNGLIQWYIHTEQYENALKIRNEIKEEIEEDRGYLWSQYIQGYILHKLGKKQEAEELFNLQIKLSEEAIRLKRQEATGATGGFAYYSIAACYAVMGENEKAIETLYEMEQNAFSGWYIWKILHDPMFESLWKDEEFKAIIQRQEKKFADIRAEIDRLEAAGEL
jgi:TolB-like protein/class 3 adenylate cyclase